MDKQKQYRHGDVFLRATVVPVTAIEQARDNGDVVLAYGEVTGHAHRIKERTVKMWSVGDQWYITVERPSELTHEEHGTITLPPGSYEVVHQREYDYLAEMPRNVAD